MTTFAGAYCDGQIAERTLVVVDVEGEEVRISGEFVPFVVARSDFTPDDPVPGVSRTLRLKEGGTLETDAYAAVEALWPTRSAIARIAFGLESRWIGAIGAVAIITVFASFIVTFALPTLAEPIAAALSKKVQTDIGNQTLATLDRTILERTRLPQSRVDEINDEFEAFMAGEPDADHVWLEFRGMPGANAFALPGGIVVVSDEMVKLAANDDELLAVIAHEIGHERHRHGIRLVLQNSGLVVLITALAGDAVGMTMLAAALPTAILQSRYSRQFEAEADADAFAHLKRHGKSPQAFADIMRRLQKSVPRDEDERGLVQYLSSHPATEERIRRAEQER